MAIADEPGGMDSEKARVWFVINYLDDFLQTGAPASDECAAALSLPAVPMISCLDMVTSS